MTTQAGKRFRLRVVSALGVSAVLALGCAVPAANASAAETGASPAASPATAVSRSAALPARAPAAERIVGVAVLGETAAEAPVRTTAEATRASGDTTPRLATTHPADAGSLPSTGARVVLLVLCVGALAAAGTVALRTARSRP